MKNKTVTKKPSANKYSTFTHTLNNNPVKKKSRSCRVRVRLDEMEVVWINKARED